MNGRDLTLGLVGALALGAAVGRRGSRSTAPFVSQHGPYTITVMFQPAAPGKRNASGRAEATLNGSEIGEVVFEDYGRLYVQWSSVDKDHRRQGLASAMYDAIERATGLPLTSGDIASSLGALGLWIKRGKLTREQALERYGEWVSRDDEFLEGSEGYEEMMDTARRALRGSRATDLTSTPAFRRWFGESKVVDGAGKPLVVFHGSVEAGFDSFTRRSIGIYFTGDYEAAQLYAGSWDAGEWTNTDDAHRVYRVYLQITNPLVVDAKGADYHDIVFHDLPAPIRKAIGKPPSRAAHVEIEDIARIAPRLGYDGVIVRNVVDEAGQEPGGVWWREDASPTNVYVVFSPTQIKSATGNRGTFDPADPRISFNRGVR